MPSAIKISELSSGNISPQNINYFHIVSLDTNNTSQSATGSVVTFTASSFHSEIWSASASNLTSLYTSVNTNSSVTWNYQGNDVKSVSSNWQTTYSTVGTSSAAWDSAYSTRLPLSGGIMTGPLTLSAGTIINIPLTQGIFSTDYTAVLSDAGQHFYHPVGDDNPRTFTIPADASVPYPIGSTLTVVNDKNNVTVAINSDVMVLAGGTSTGSRTLSATGIATALKVTATRWIISGTNLT